MDGVVTVQEVTHRLDPQNIDISSIRLARGTATDIQ